MKNDLQKFKQLQKTKRLFLLLVFKWNIISIERRFVLVCKTKEIMCCPSNDIDFLNVFVSCGF